MANTLPGTPYVESSDLVANYPAVSESLAERVDLVGVLPFADAAARTTALPTPTDGQYSYLQDTNSTEFYNGSAWVAAGVAPGLVHINTTTFTSVASVALNNIFSSDYDNYTIWMYSTKTSYIDARLRVSGVDAAGSDYDARLLNVFGASVSSSLQTNGTAMQIGENITVTYTNIDLFNPFQASKTVLKFDNFDETDVRNRYIVHKLSTSYDGMNFLARTGSMTGIIRVYGLKNS